MSRIADLARRIAASNKSVTLVFFLSYDLTNARNEYTEINKTLEDAGYSRDSNLGEDSLPRNFFAGKKKVSYNSEQKELKDVIQEQTEDFKEEVSSIINKLAPKKLTKLCVLVSLNSHTGIKIVDNS